MDKSFYKSYFSLEENNWWFRVRRNIIFDLLKTLKISKGSKILDFGCGSGFLVGKLQEQGYNAYGTDQSDEAINYRRDLVKNLSIQSTEKIGFPDDSFDLVMALDVVEHIKDDALAVRELERVLKPGGFIIYTVPAYQWLWGVQDEVAQHYRRYTVGSLSKLVRQNTDLKIFRKTYFNTFLFPPIAVVRMVSKFLKFKNRESDFDIASGFIDKVLFQIFDFERKLLRLFDFIFGVSVLLIAHSPQD